MALTKKMAKQIANLINECTVTEIMSRSAENQMHLDLSERIEKVRWWRARHDQAANTLNDILGERAVTPYKRDR